MLDPIDFERDANKLFEKRKKKVEGSFERESTSIQNAAKERIEEIKALNATREEKRWECPIIGAGVGFVASLASCSAGAATIQGSIAMVIIGLLAGIGVNYLINANIKSNKAKIVDIQTKMDEDINALAEHRDEMIRRHAQERDTQIAEYKSEFEANAREQSAKFALSPITQEISTQLIKSFKAQIESFDRSPHVPTVNVPFHFSVLRDEVVGPAYSYDFEHKRVENLSTLSEQCGLANAIASSIRSAIVMDYPEDPAGCTVNPMKISFSYKEAPRGNIDTIELQSYVEVSMTYSATNGNYTARRTF